MHEGYTRLDEADLETAGEDWNVNDVPQDLDRFLSTVYTYYEQKGYWGFVSRSCSHLVALSFYIGFSFLLLFFVDWNALLSCVSEETCRHARIWYRHPFEKLSLWRCIVFAYGCLGFVYWLYNVLVLRHHLGEASDKREYFRERLGICDDALCAMTWAEVVRRLVQQQEVSPFCIVQERLTALDVANIIMREDNWMIAFANHGVLTSCLPNWIPPRIMFTKAVLWNFRFLLFDGCLTSERFFDSQSRISSAVYGDVAGLATRSKVMSILNCVFILPILLGAVVFFFMRHAEDFRSHRSTPFERKWTEYAEWSFREFNELPHEFRARLAASEDATRALGVALRNSSTQGSVLKSIRSCVKHISGSILAILVFIAFFDDAPLLFVHIGGRNLLWYLAFFGIMVALASEVDAAQQVNNTGRVPSPVHIYSTLMSKVKCSHFLPWVWRLTDPLKKTQGRNEEAEARAEFSRAAQRARQEIFGQFFCPRIQVLVDELFGVVLAPIIFFFFFPRAAPGLLELVRNCRYETEKLGDWCAYGRLDLGINGNEAYLHAAPCHSQGCRSRDGKLEKSALRFALAYQLPPDMRFTVQKGDGEDNDRSFELLESIRPTGKMCPDVAGDRPCPREDACPDPHTDAELRAVMNFTAYHGDATQSSVEEAEALPRPLAPQPLFASEEKPATFNEAQEFWQRGGGSESAPGGGPRVRQVNAADVRKSLGGVDGWASYDKAWGVPGSVLALERFIADYSKEVLQEHRNIGKLPTPLVELLPMDAHQRPTQDGLQTVGGHFFWLELLNEQRRVETFREQSSQRPERPAPFQGRAVVPFQLAHSAGGTTRF
eukprot:CAMPEP_0204374970 /NCGR_PEP_ID=MMETSP0469-20131031/48940_1 /ASSEMBLY_ACC=CAM_ASM_000384 /TAXON_ID=2969 /ORGANISM="Oxyrrhis marina" /LENGTH=831 /DNA_ID=CAMNT_0051365595 /DNA_START=8 /DNA_END=2503 /DNA_ORIENTATION=-